MLEEAAARGRLVIRFDAGESRLEPAAQSVDGALADLVGIVYTAMADGTWSRLKACRRDVCGWLFYDRSRNRSAVWCQMAVCGNRVKTKAYRERTPGTNRSSVSQSPTTASAAPTSATKMPPMPGHVEREEVPRERRDEHERVERRASRRRARRPRAARRRLVASSARIR